jgi:hypothetical protein
MDGLPPRILEKCRMGFFRGLLTGPGDWVNLLLGYHQQPDYEESVYCVGSLQCGWVVAIDHGLGRPLVSSVSV